MSTLKPRQQGDIGELSAMEWLASRGAHIYVSVGHSPDVDLIAEIDRVVLRIEVKTATYQISSGRWKVQVATRGGDQSWSGVAKYFDRERCDYLFVHVGDGRRWFIPTGAIDGKSSLALGGDKYADFEIEQGRCLERTPSERDLQSPGSPGEYRSGQTGCAVNAVALSFGGSNPPSPISSPRRVKPTNYERKPGQRGEVLINQKRPITIPQRPFFEAGFENGGRVRVRAVGPGRMLIEQIELPDWSREPAGAERRAPD
jgi:Holliday junction resolvase-like predicted endonuclease